MFGKKRKLEEFEAAGAAAAKRLLDSDNLPELQSAAKQIRNAWGDAGFPQGDALAIAGALEARIEKLKRRQFEQAVRPCAQCSGRAFRISEEMTIDNAGPLRLVVCDACRATVWFWVREGSLEARFGPLVEVPSAGPFR
ncbi:MAG: hypothetical protein H0V17_16470 [Deltaproteobacteria bacterium]|nr:hypothetical protein [Deltaproteobacteria bacterium]